ncbi:MAG: exodeoxyribonuclease VII small subunit [Ruminococcus sp.]|nr:exodeoxyribonuclease VII small subunit [Ruminococcus sp.]
MWKLLTSGDNMNENLTFEDNMKKLGEIVSQLEKGDIPLERAVELYGEGVGLSVKCRRQLEEAQLKITEDGGTAPKENEEA